MSRFELIAPFKPCGDQPKAIAQLTAGISKDFRYQTLLGVTGSGKTFTVANVIAQINKPTLVISHNKTLAAQLYYELKGFFPHNSVEYFVSYYDYYQPEAYLPATDTYIEKDSSINEELDRLRLAATCSLITRQDVIIVASVSCIYNIGSPQEYKDAYLFLETGENFPRNEILKRLVEIHYERNDIDFSRGKFRVRGDTIEVFPSYYEDTAYRIELFGDEVEKICEINPLTGKITSVSNRLLVYPAKHFVTTQSRLERALLSIEMELDERVTHLRGQNKLLEAQRLESRTKYDMEIMREIGTCHGIENYSRHFDGRRPGERPWTLIDYFPKDFLLIIDESHVTLPQLKGMYEGDRSRKQSLVDYGFRLPSAYDNRPLKLAEFERLMPQTIFVSATPGDYELKVSSQIVELIIRPTGLVDPKLDVRKVEGQIDNLIREIRARVANKERILVTTLTKRMAEDLAEYLSKMDIKVRYLHSEIQTLDRVEILRDLRLGEFDVLVGINLLREGLDLPEVSLVAVLDADKEGYLRSERSLIQVFGRTARHINGQVIMYGNTITGSMKRAIDETNRRRKIQMEYNQTYGITPQTIQKAIAESLVTTPKEPKSLKDARVKYKIKGDISSIVKELERQMYEAADNLEYEKAAVLRDEIYELKNQLYTS
ncbi:MAG: excinuclease ABC subunit UvrB [bacterium]